MARSAKPPQFDMNQYARRAGYLNEPLTTGRCYKRRFTIAWLLMAADVMRLSKRRKLTVIHILIDGSLRVQELTSEQFVIYENASKVFLKYFGQSNPLARQRIQTNLWRKIRHLSL